MAPEEPSAADAEAADALALATVGATWQLTCLPAAAAALEKEKPTKKGPKKKPPKPTNISQTLRDLG